MLRVVQLGLLAGLLSVLPVYVQAQAQAAAAFAPTIGACPRGTSLLRTTGTTPFTQRISSDEAAYIKARQELVSALAFRTYLHNVEAIAAKNHVSLPLYLESILTLPSLQPTLGIASSGGGYRAAIFGASVLNTLDSRNSTSNKVGLGGLLQASTYLTGLSGGSWLVMSLSQADFPPLPEVIFGSSTPGAFAGWNAQFDILNAPVSNDTPALVLDLLGETAGKAAQGFPVTVTDVWSRGLSRHFVNGTTADTFFDPNVTHGAGETFSGLLKLSSFEKHAQPFPIIVADSISNKGNASQNFNESEIFIPLTNPMYEFSPFETGSFDPMVAAFTPTKFLGSPPDKKNAICVTGFDQVSYIEGISSSLFNTENITFGSLEASPFGPIGDALIAAFNESNIELDAALVPNPFLGHSPKTFIDSGETMLRLVDGGEDGQTTPLQPLLVQARDVDTIIAIDAPADTSANLAVGFSLVASQQRTFEIPHFYNFPPVPTSVDTFIALNLTKRPTFFGCNDPTTSMLIYIANGGPPLNQTAVTNIPTAQTVFQPDQIQAVFDQTFDIATQGIPVVDKKTGALEKDPLWPVCLACAVVDKKRAKAGLRREGVCESCLKKYCWS